MLEVTELSMDLDDREGEDVATTLTKISSLTSPAAKLRLAARSLEIRMLLQSEDDEEFQPPEELLLYLVRLVYHPIQEIYSFGNYGPIFKLLWSTYWVFSLEILAL